MRLAKATVQREAEPAAVSKQTINLPVVRSAIFHEATCIYEENYAMYKLPADRKMLVTVAVARSWKA